MVENSAQQLCFGTLNSIERFHYFDSNAKFPNRIACRLLVAQPICPFVSKKACFYLAQRHPILTCSIEKIGRQLCWIQYPDRYQIETKFDPSNQECNPVTTESTPNVSFDTPWFFWNSLQFKPVFPPNFEVFQKQAGPFAPFMLIRQWSYHHSHSDVYADNQSESSHQPNEVMAEIWLSIHHSYCDGGGGVAIINDWVQIYDNLRFKQHPTEGMLAVDQHRFTKRNHLGLCTRKFLRKLAFQPVGLFGATKFIFRKTASLDQLEPLDQPAADKDTSSENLDQPADSKSHTAISSLWLDESDLCQLEKESSEKDINLNARLVADLMVALEKWRIKWLPQASANHWQRIILPINIREIGDRRLPAANRSSIVQIDRRRLSTQDRSTLARSIQREVGVIINWKLDRMFLIFMKIIGLSNYMLRHVAQNKKHRGIAVFTNLGQPFKRLEKRVNSSTTASRASSKTFPLAQGSTKPHQPEQGLPLDPIEIDFLAPLRHGTSLNFTVATFKKRLRITLHYDPLVVSTTQADDLMQTFRNHLVSPDDSKTIAHQDSK